MQRLAIEPLYPELASVHLTESPGTVSERCPSASVQAGRAPRNASFVRAGNVVVDALTGSAGRTSGPPQLCLTVRSRG